MKVRAGRADEVVQHEATIRHPAVWTLSLSGPTNGGRSVEQGAGLTTYFESRGTSGDQVAAANLASAPGQPKGLFLQANGVVGLIDGGDHPARKRGVVPLQSICTTRTL